MMAQIQNVQPTFLHQATLLLIGVLSGGAAVATIIGVFLKRRNEIHPQPLEVKEAQKFVTREHCDQVHQMTGSQMLEVKASLGELRGKMERDKQEAGFSRKAIYAEIKSTNEGTRQHIEDVRKELSADINDVKDKLLDKIDGISDKVIATLRNAGAIGKEK